jgi:hypothetical protein
VYKLAQVRTPPQINGILNARFAGGLQNATDDTTASLIWKQGLGNKTKKSIIRKTLCNTYYTQLVRKRNLRSTTDGQYGMDETMARKRLKLELVSLDYQSENVGGNVNLEEEDNLHSFLRISGEKEITIPLTKWILGNICTHQRCKQCSAVLSRKHGLECSGAIEKLEYLDILENRQENDKPHLNALCYVLDKVKGRSFRENKRLYVTCAEAIGLIYTKCLGYKRKKNGFYVDPSDLDSPEGIG